jgi:hypothetical protein
MLISQSGGFHAQAVDSGCDDQRFEPRPTYLMTIRFRCHYDGDLTTNGFNACPIGKLSDTIGCGCDCVKLALLRRSWNSMISNIMVFHDHIVLQEFNSAKTSSIIGFRYITYTIYEVPCALL